MLVRSISGRNVTHRNGCVRNDSVFLLHDVTIGILTSLNRLASSQDVTLPILSTMIAVVALKVPPSNVFLYLSSLSIAKIR